MRELCIYTNRRLLPGSTKIRTKINPCLSKRNPWGTTRSHCWTTTLPWPTTSARNGPSHQSLWPKILGKCFVTRLFRKWTFEFNQQFLSLFFWKEIFQFLWPTALWTFLWLMGNSSSQTQTAGLPSLLHSFASPVDQVVTWESTSCTLQKPAKHKQKHWLKNQRSKYVHNNSQNVDHSLSCSNANAWGFGLHKGPP